MVQKHASDFSYRDRRPLHVTRAQLNHGKQVVLHTLGPAPHEEHMLAVRRGYRPGAMDGSSGIAHNGLETAAGRGDSMEARAPAVDNDLLVHRPCTGAKKSRVVDLTQVF